ncbi:MmcQ/YjbR family DNA-binding protein [Pseudohoeflea suaedae]|uniref:MmcQ/YjbR family DNA-binding protein n=1 Tax=Pseudohoeflea suaedae TaxID=877384 RepID=A0A4R5PI37_9HYPH|nr:MmcQ/YjbR family DNA-binding protein [Pseudohoeflea suaedae]TDH34877.1 MmcQ/YjbR family DNA-binding protein [Pseudohoeflea suaedae]
MLDLETYNRICSQLTGARHVRQWGDAHVWKVGEKVFALGREQDDGTMHVTFKASDMAWEIFRDTEGVRPAPYLASRGLKWLQRTDDSAMDDETLTGLIADSHGMAAANLTRKRRRELGLAD